MAIKLTQEQQEKLVGKMVADFTDEDIAAIRDYEERGAPADISDTDHPELGAIHMRVQTLEALVEHLFNTHYRGSDRDAIVKTFLANRKGSEKISKE